MRKERAVVDWSASINHTGMPEKILSWWKKLLGGLAAKPGPINLVNIATTDIERLCEAAALARRRYWSGIGEVDPDVLGQLIASRFIQDVPLWPSGRETFLVIRKSQTIVLATDGLSDPDKDEFKGRNGHGIELFLEAPAAELTNPIGSAYLNILIQMARNTVAAGQFFDRWRKFQLLTMELPAEEEDRRLVNMRGNHVVLLGAPGFDTVPGITGMPLPSPVKAMAVTLVHPDDFEQIAGQGASGRQRLASALKRQGLEQISDLGRRAIL